MNAKQKREVIKLLEKDCQIDSSYISESGKKTCAIGCLALKAGVERARLLKDNGTLITHHRMRDVADAIFKRFGLSRRYLSVVQYQNDYFDSVSKRRAAVVNYVKTIPVK